MNADSQTLVDAIEAGEMTDPGAMTTTQDVTHAVEDPYSTVDKQLHTLANEGVIERKTFGREEVWVVPEVSGRTQVETRMPTDTRDPHAGE